VTEHEVGELLAVLQAHYQDMRVNPGERLIWNEQLRPYDSDDMMTITGIYMARHADWPTPAELRNLFSLRFERRPRMRATAWAAYEAECIAQGRAPSSAAFREEIDRRKETHSDE